MAIASCHVNAPVPTRANMFKHEGVSIYIHHYIWVQHGAAIGVTQSAGIHTMIILFADEGTAIEQTSARDIAISARRTALGTAYLRNAHI